MALCNRAGTIYKRHKYNLDGICTKCSQDSTSSEAAEVRNTEVQTPTAPLEQQVTN